MKSKMSVTLNSALVRGIENHVADFKSRSEFIEVAVQYFIAHLEREEAERRDVQIINERADALNAEAEDALSYQVMP